MTTTACEFSGEILTITTNPRKIYRELRRLGWRASDALRSARIRAEFAALEGNQVRLRVVPDDDWSFAIECACDDAERCTARNRERAERDGVWGIVSEYLDPLTGEWEHADSVWGFIGDDWENSGADDDVRQAALDALRYRERLARA